MRVGTTSPVSTRVTVTPSSPVVRITIRASVGMPVPPSIHASNPSNCAATVVHAAASIESASAHPTTDPPPTQVATRADLPCTRSPGSRRIPGYVLVMRAALLAALGCTGPERPLAHEGYVWERVWTDPVREGVAAAGEALDGLRVNAAAV